MVLIETKVCHVPTCMAIVQNIFKHELEYHSESLPAEVLTLLKINSIAKEKEIFTKKRKIQNNIRSNYFEKRKRSPSPVAPKQKFGEKHLKQLQHKPTSPIPVRKAYLRVLTKKNSILGQFYRTVDETNTPSPVRESVTPPKVARFGEVTSELNIKVETTSSDEVQSTKGILNGEGHDSRSNNRRECSTSKKRDDKKVSKTAKKELRDSISLLPNNDKKSSMKINKSTPSELPIKEENVSLEEPTLNSNTIESPEKVKKKKKDKSSSKNKKLKRSQAEKLKGNSTVEELSNELSLHEEQNNSVTSSSVETHEVPDIEVPEFPVMASESEAISKEVKAEMISEAEHQRTITASAVKDDITPCSPVPFDAEEPPEVKCETVEDSDEDIILMEEVGFFKTRMRYNTESGARKKNNYDDFITDFILSENIVAPLSQCRQNSTLQLCPSTCQIIRQIILVILYLKVLNFEALISMRVCDFMCPKHLEGYVLIEPSVESLSDFKPIKLLKSHYKYIRNFIVTIRPKLSSDPYGLLFTDNGQNALTAEEAKKITLMCWNQSELNFNISQLF